MKLNIDNYKKYVPENDQNLFYSLLIDLKELNNMLNGKTHYCKDLCIGIETEHTEYSEERTEPCPDYFGTYTLYCENDKYNNISSGMTIDELENAIYILYKFVEIY